MFSCWQQQPKLVRTASANQQAASCPAGGPASCKSGISSVIASTAPGQPSALASPNEAYALVLQPNGRLVIVERATGRQHVLSNTLFTCVMPVQLMMLPSGHLVLRDKMGTILWSSTSACKGNSTCYTYTMRNDGQLVVTDGVGAMVWSSNSSAPGTSSQPLGWLEQLTSGGSTNLSCVQSGPVPAAMQLYSPGRKAALRLQQANATLQLLSLPSNTVLWSPPRALPGRAPASLCVTRQGSLYLQGLGGQKLWSTVPQAAGFAPYNVILTDEGCLDLVDSQCSLLWSSHSQAGTRGARSPPGSASGRAARPPKPRTPRASSSSGKAPRTRPPVPPQPVSSASSSQAPPRLPRTPAPAPVSSPQSSSDAQARPDRPRKSTVQSPPPAQGSFASAHSPQCSLTRGTLCDGISMCGRDAVCAQQGCCQGSLLCTRSSKYTWFCRA